MKVKCNGTYKSLEECWADGEHPINITAITCILIMVKYFQHFEGPELSPIAIWT